MGFFGNLFRAKPQTNVKDDSASDTSADAGTDSGLSPEGEKAIAILALTQNFLGLEKAFKHSLPKVRLFVLKQLTIANSVRLEPDGTISIGIDSQGNFKKEKPRPEAMKLLRLAAKDTDHAVADEANKMLEAVILG